MNVKKHVYSFEPTPENLTIENMIYTLMEIVYEPNITRFGIIPGNKIHHQLKIFVDELSKYDLDEPDNNDPKSPLDPKDDPNNKD